MITNLCFAFFLNAFILTDFTGILSEYSNSIYGIDLVQKKIPHGFGYSCLTMVDENTVGILYEGTKSLYFQKVPVKDILRKNSLKAKN